MSDPARPPDRLVGLVRVREHCAFPWEQPVTGGTRVARVRTTHCPECVAELRKLGYLVTNDEAEEPSVG
jgi:hypothetical protein